MQTQSKSTWRASPPSLGLEDCTFCHGTGWQLLSSAGLSRARRCSCVALQRKVLLREQIHIPPQYDHCTLGNFEPATLSQARALGEVQRLVEKFPRIERDLFLTGDPGVGKTHLAVAALLELLQRFREDLFFTDSSTLLNMSGIGTRSVAEVNRRMQTASLLVVDDLELELLTDDIWAFLCEIHSARRRAGKPTIITAERMVPERAPADRRNKIDAKNVKCSSRLKMRFLMQWMSCAKTIAISGQDRRLGSTPLF